VGGSHGENGEGTNVLSRVFRRKTSLAGVRLGGRCLTRDHRAADEIEFALAGMNHWRLGSERQAQSAQQANAAFQAIRSERVWHWH
jgi:hypothetical protein